MSNHDATLVQVTTRVLEELCFHFAEACAPDAAPAEPVCAHVHFRGPWSGTMVVGVNRELLGELAANLLGDEITSELDESHTLLELANVICGNALPEIASRESEFVLDAPELCLASQLGDTGGRFASAALDEGRVIVHLSRVAAS